MMLLTGGGHCQQLSHYCNGLVVLGVKRFTTYEAIVIRETRVTDEPSPRGSL